MSAATTKRVYSSSQIGRIIACAALLALAGCAQQQQARQQHAPESTLTDAQAQARGRTAGAPPSQIQLGFGEDAPRQAQSPDTEAQQADKAAIASQVRPLREAKTFLGTLPCLLGGACEASRVTLTLAPNGQWRARSQPLSAGGTAPAAQQGCWEVTGSSPWRIRLSPGGAESSMASLTFVNDNLLRVNSVNDHQPLLDYHLTRQADIDGITELDAATAPVCQ